MFEGSNWCMQSEQFLHSLDEKTNQCDTSEEASSLSAELAVYLSVTKDEQMERVSKVIWFIVVAICYRYLCCYRFNKLAVFYTVIH